MEPYGCITHLCRTNWIPRKTEQTGHVLKAEIVAGVFPPVAEDNTEYSIESYSALKIFVTVINTLLNPHIFSMVQSRVLEIWKRNKTFKYQPNFKW